MRSSKFSKKNMGDLCSCRCPKCDKTDTKASIALMLSSAGLIITILGFSYLVLLYIINI